MRIPETLLEIQEFTGEGYIPLFDYGAWRVAMLRFIDDVLPENIYKMQRHDETDEVFVLLGGNCTLFVGEGKESIVKIYSQFMQPFQVYNIKRSCWHALTLSKNGRVLIIENRNTTDENSPFISLSSAQRQEIINLAKKMVLKVSKEY